jgi:hypothetical protein
MIMKNLILLLSVLVLGSGSAGLGASKWAVQIVDGKERGSETGTFSNIVIDSQDRPRISYYDGGDNCLRFAAWDGRSWQRETVDRGGPRDRHSIGRFNCMAIDSRDRCHISYRDRRYYRLKYVVQNESGGWETAQIVDDPGPIRDRQGKGFVGVGRFTSIALDSKEHPHISYTDLDNNALKYAKWNGSSWEIQRVYQGVKSIGGTSIQLDSRDRPHIAFTDGGSSERLKCARWNGAGWDIQTIDPHGGFESPTCMAIDANDNLHVVCDNLYSRSEGSKWIKQVIPNVTGGGSSLKLDRNGRPHIAQTQNNNMWYVHWNGREWIAECADDDPEVGEERCIALDSKGIPHITYWAQKFYDENQLRYATIVPSPKKNLRK